MDNYPLSSNFHFGNEMCWPYVDANDLIVFFHHIILIHLKHMQNVHNNKAQNVEKKVKRRLRKPITFRWLSARQKWKETKIGRKNAASSPN